ncbi:uncharacterized protein [Battus philenor]|uniref:uncharacterized protein n=1 Tax=Battus philenor TaxID=42288 RepID=UPI0035CEA89C
MNNVSLALLCRQAFTEEEITEAKSLLFDSVQQKRVKRRGDEGKNKNIEDIIGLLKGAEPEIFPIFVARDLQKLPPVTFDHVDVTRLLKDIIVMQREISSLTEKCESFQETYVRKVDLKQEVDFYCQISNDLVAQTKSYPNVNYKRGGYCLHSSPDCNSGPMGLMTVREDTEMQQPMTEQKRDDDHLSLSSTSVTNNGADTSVPVAHTQRQVSRLHVEATRSATAVSTFETVNEAPAQSAGKMTSCEAISAVQSAADKQNKDDGEWIRVQRRKASKFKGMRGTAAVEQSGRFKAAEVHVPMFIYNVSKEVTEQDVADYVLEKMHINIVPEKVNNRNIEKDYNSFKFLIPRNKLPLFTDKDSWPEGIYFRKYIRFNKGNKGNADRATTKN